MSPNVDTDTALPMIAHIGAHIDALMNVVKTGKTALLMCNPAGSYPQHLWSGDPMKVTPAKARAALARYQVAARKEMPAQAADIPESLNVCIKRTYKVSGKNPRTEPLFAYALLRIRRADKRAQRSAARTAALNVAAKNGGHWFAQGVATPYADETKARKAWARVHIGADWWADKDAKAGNLAAAVVRQGKAYAATKAKAAPAKKATTVQSSTTVTVTVADLRASCKALGLPTTGRKATLVARIQQHTLGL